MIATRHQRRMTLKEATFVIKITISGKIPDKWRWWTSQLYYKAAATIDRHDFQTRN